VASQLTQKQTIEELYRRGVLQWKLHSGQQRMYDAIAGSTAKRFVVNASRRLGKSFMLCVLAIEFAIRNPGSQIKFGAPNQKMARKIIFPLFKQILEDCPKPLRPKFRVHDGEYQFANGSSITVCGTEMGQVDNLRGTACDLALLDECGFMTELTYVVDSIITPQLLTRPNGRIIMASTPPVSPDHPFVQRYMMQAMEQNAYARFDIYSNPMLTAQQIEEFKREAGGADSTTWRREYLAEIVTETDNALFPEVSAGQLLDELVVELRRPEHLIPITAVDLGYLDYTGVLLGYYHFPLAKIVIEDEILVNKCTSATLVQMIKDKEKAMWGDLPVRTRVVDGNPLTIADLNETHRFACRVPDKADLDASVNRVRIDFGDKRLLINPRCSNLIAQVRYATWDKTRTKFSRSSSNGHWDLAAALCYLCRHIDRTTNPQPAGFGWNTFTDFGFPRRHANAAAERILAMFPRLVPLPKDRPPTR
jgi:hypothetical protein